MSRIQLRSAFLGLALLGGGAAGVSHAGVVDGFDGQTIDFTQWRTFSNEHLPGRTAAVEQIREVDTDQGQAILGAATTGVSQDVRTALRIRNPGLSGLSGTVSITEIDRGDGEATIGIAGSYYNAVYSGDPTDSTGEVFAHVRLGDRGDGLEAWWEIIESTSPDWSAFTVRDNGTLLPPGDVDLGVEYRIGMSHDGETGFAFSLDGQMQTGEGPPRTTHTRSPLERFAVTLFEGGGNERKMLRGTVSEPTIAGSPGPYDTFTAARLDPAKWLDFASVRTVDDGRLRLTAQGEGLADSTASFARERLILRHFQNPDYFQATVSISDTSELDSGITGRAGLSAFVYNQERDGGEQADTYNGAEGDVFATIRLQLQDTTVQAVTYMESVNADYSTREPLMFEQFPRNLELNTAYTLSIRRIDDQIIFGLDDETITYTPGTQMYPPSPAGLDGMRAVQTEVRGSGSSSPAGAGGILRGSFANVSTEPLSAEPDESAPDAGAPEDTTGNGSSGSSGGCSALGHGGGNEIPVLLLILMLMIRTTGAFSRR